MTEIRKDLPEVGKSDATINVLQTSFQSAFALLGEIVDQGSLEQQLIAARALGKIARGSQELLGAYQAVFPDEQQERIVPAELPSSTVAHETALHIVPAEASDIEDEEQTAPLSDVSVRDEDEAIIPLADTREEDVVQNTTMLDTHPEPVRVESDTIPESIPAEVTHTPIQTKAKHPSEASPVDEEGFTEKERLILTYLQNNGELEVRSAELVSHYMQHFSCANERAARQAVGKAIRTIKAHPDYVDKLKAQGNTVARRYVYLENPSSENTQLAGSADEKTPTDLLPLPQGTDKQASPPVLERIDNDAFVLEQNQSVHPASTVQPEESAPPVNTTEAESSTDTNESIIEKFTASVDSAKLPEGFVPLTQYGIGYVVGENGKKTLYLKDTPHLLKGVALNIFEHLLTSSTGEAEYVTLKKDIEKQLGYEISIKNFNTAVHDLEKRFANNNDGFFSELRVMNKVHYRYIGVRGLLNDEQREEIQHFLAPSSEELHQS